MATDSGGMSDESIANHLVNGREEGYRQLFAKHGGRVGAHLERRYRYLHDDYIHQAMADAARKTARTYTGSRGPLGPWFMRLADQAVIVILRGEPDYEGLVSDTNIPDRRQTPQEELISAETIAEVLEEVDKLPDLQRSIIQADIDARRPVPAKVLAKSLGTTPKSIYEARRRAREKLRHCLSPEFLEALGGR